MKRLDGLSPELGDLANRMRLWAVMKSISSAVLSLAIRFCAKGVTVGTTPMTVVHVPSETTQT